MCEDTAAIFARRYITARRLFSVDTDDSSNATINARSRRTNRTDLMLTCCLSAANGWLVSRPTNSLAHLCCCCCCCCIGYRMASDTRCCFNVRSKADMSQLNLPHGTNYYKKLSYHRVTARCVLSVVISPITTQQCRNYLKLNSTTRARPDPTGPTRTRTDPHGLCRKPARTQRSFAAKKSARDRAGPVGSSRVRVVEFSYYTTSPDQTDGMKLEV